MSQLKDRANKASMLRTHDTDYKADISSDDNLYMLPSTPAKVAESSAPYVDVRQRALKSVQSLESITEDSSISPEVASNINNRLEDVPNSTSGDSGDTPVTRCSSDGSSTLVSPQIPHISQGNPSPSPSAGSSSSPYPSSSSPCIRLPDHENVLLSTPRLVRTPSAGAEGPNTSAKLPILSERSSYRGPSTTGLSPLSISSSPPVSSPAAYIMRRSLSSRLDELHLDSQDLLEAGPSSGHRTKASTTASQSAAQTFRVVEAVGGADEVLSLTPDLNIKIKTRNTNPSRPSVAKDLWLPVLPFQRAPEGVKHEFDELVTRLKTMMGRREDEFGDRVVATLRSLVSEN